MKRPITQIAFAAFGFSIALTAIGLARDEGGPTPEAAEVLAKQQKLHGVVAELRSRGPNVIGALPSDRIAARTRALDLLEAYADRGQFTLHHEPWPREMPLFIDEQGTRCALASVFDGFGEDAIVQRLARDCNDAYLAEIADDPEIVRCLDEIGLTLDEAAYIQDPGNRIRRLAWRDGGGGSGGSGSNTGSDGVVAPNTSGGNETENERPSGSEPRPSGPVTERGTGPTTPRDGGPTARPGGAPDTGRAPRSGPVTGGRRDRDEASAFRWIDWWDAKRGEYQSVRAAYHGAIQAAVTPDASRDARPERPSAAQIRAELLPFFAATAREREDVRSTALAMWARGASPEDAPQVVAAVLRFLADPNAPERFWAPVMLAILADPSARAPLADLLLDSPAGRGLMKRSGAIPDDVRALSAIAYGRCGGAIEVLARTLAAQPAAHVDLAAACLVGIGFAAREPAQRTAAIAFLVGQLENPALPAIVLAQLPAALALAGDPAGLPALFNVVARFRGPRELRRSSALALGELAPDLDESTFDALAALVRRDVDAECRHAAIIALGALAARHGATAAPPVVEKLVCLGEDALAGRLRHDEDLPWHALAAGLFARGRPQDGSKLLPALRRLALEDGDDSMRAAACLALGLARDRQALELEIGALDRGSDLVASCAIDALGLLGTEARPARSRLIELCVTSPSESIGFAAGGALGSLADPTTIDVMAAAFERTSSASVRAALARSLGEIGDRRAIDVLRRVASDPSRDAPSRERAIAALGVIAQADDAAWNEPLKQALNPGEVTPSLQLLLELF